MNKEILSIVLYFLLFFLAVPYVIYLLVGLFIETETKDFFVVFYLFMFCVQYLFIRTKKL